MSRPGMGVMLRWMAGNHEAVEAHNAAVGRVIASADIQSNEEDLDGRGGALILRFTDGSGIRLWDNGQSCCEERWMHTDDDLGAFVGAVFRGAEVREGGEEDAEYGTKETEFLIVTTDRGAFTVVNYNEHNGYYGGFAIDVRPLED